MADTIDFTPAMVWNWKSSPQGAPLKIVTVNEQATVHQLAALAWSMSSDLETVAAMAAYQHRTGVDHETISRAIDMLEQQARNLTLLLDDLAERTAAAEGGAS